MTIIAYHKGTIYSDRIHELPLDEFAGNRYSSKKLFVNHDRTIAFCYTGLEVNPKSTDSIFMIFQSMIELDRRMKPVSTSNIWLTDQHIEVILKTEKRFYIVITRDEAYFIKEGLVVNLDKKDILTDGLDGEYFKALALTGMDVKQIIPYVHDNLSRRVTKEFDYIQQNRLKPLRLINDELSQGEVITKLNLKLQEIKDRELQS